ncbi:hypothetical protein DSM01_1403, partial [Leeuwenhoekiella palythoae]
ALSTLGHQTGEPKPYSGKQELFEQLIANAF